MSTILVLPLKHSSEGQIKFQIKLLIAYQKLSLLSVLNRKLIVVKVCLLIYLSIDPHRPHG